jgi:hypothetical protein
VSYKGKKVEEGPVPVPVMNTTGTEILFEGVVMPRACHGSIEPLRKKVRVVFSLKKFRALSLSQDYGPNALSSIVAVSSVNSLVNSVVRLSKSLFAHSNIVFQRNLTGKRLAVEFSRLLG